jgi:RES domain-containing protein
VISLWRISNHADLEGVGGEVASGRWHRAERGKRIVYLAEHPALALLEVLVNLKGDPRKFPDQYQLSKVNVSSDVYARMESITRLSSDWLDNTELTRNIGDDILSKGQTVLAKVPSAVCPESFNYLLNPLGPDAVSGVSVEWSRKVTYDKRLFHIYP